MRPQDRASRLSQSRDTRSKPGGRADAAPCCARAESEVPISASEDDRPGGEPPCFLHRLDPEQGGLVDDQTHRDVARWRRAERERLIAARLALPVAARSAGGARIAAGLDRLLGDTAGAVVAITWPFRGEADLRPWAEARRGAGAVLALPVVIEKAAPLVFRLWPEGAALERGVWNIPVPGAALPEVIPDIVVAPVVGLDDAGYRLGYGGGFYDRTLARLRRDGHRPRVVGTGFACQRIPTIFPLPHDIAMDETVIAPAEPA